MSAYGYFCDVFENKVGLLSISICVTSDMYISFLKMLVYFFIGLMYIYIGSEMFTLLLMILFHKCQFH